MSDDSEEEDIKTKYEGAYHLKQDPSFRTFSRPVTKNICIKNIGNSKRFKIIDVAPHNYSIVLHPKINDKIRDDSLIPEIKFYAIGPLAGEGGGDTKYDKDELYMERVFFHSGCSVPFFAEIKFRGEESVIHFDPFSGYSLKTDK